MKQGIRVASLLPLLLMGWSCGDQPDAYSVTLPHFKADPGWNAIGVDFEIKAGSVVAIQNIPLGWTFTVADDADWHTKIKGICTARDAALPPDEMKRIVFQVRRNESEGAKFDISGTVNTTKAFDTGKQTAVTMQDFSLSGSQ